jgi:hypothetical protein
MVDLQQQRLVALDDQWSVVHSVHPFIAEPFQVPDLLARYTIRAMVPTTAASSR